MLSSPCIVCCDKCTFVPIFRGEHLKTEATKYVWNESYDLPDLLGDSKARAFRLKSGGPWSLYNDFLEYAAGSSMSLDVLPYGLTIIAAHRPLSQSNPQADRAPGLNWKVVSYTSPPTQPELVSQRFSVDIFGATASLGCELVSQTGGIRVYSDYGGRWTVRVVPPQVTFALNPWVHAIGGTPQALLLLTASANPPGLVEPYFAPAVRPPRLTDLEWAQYLIDRALGLPSVSYGVKYAISIGDDSRLVLYADQAEVFSDRRLKLSSFRPEGGSRIVTAFTEYSPGKLPDIDRGFDVAHSPLRRPDSDYGYSHLAPVGINSANGCNFLIYRDGELLASFESASAIQQYAAEEGSYLVRREYDGSCQRDRPLPWQRSPEPIVLYSSFVIDKTPPARAWQQSRDMFVDEFAPGVIPLAGRLNERDRGFNDALSYEYEDALQPYPEYASFNTGTLAAFRINGGPRESLPWGFEKGEYELRATEPEDRALNKTLNANTLPDVVISVRERTLDNPEIELPEDYTGPIPRFDPLLWEGIENTDGLVHQDPLSEIDLVFDSGVVILDEAMNAAATNPENEEEWLIEALQITGKDVATGEDKEAEVESIRRLSDRRFRIKISEGDQTDYNTQWAISFKPVHGGEGAEKSRVSVTNPNKNDGPLTFGKCQPCLLGCRFMWCIVQDPDIGRELIDTSSVSKSPSSVSSVSATVEDEDADSFTISASADFYLPPQVGDMHTEAEAPGFVAGTPESHDDAASLPHSYFGLDYTISPSPPLKLPACAAPMAPQRHSSLIFGPEITTLTLSRTTLESGLDLEPYGPGDFDSTMLPASITHGSSLEGAAAPQNVWCHSSQPGTQLELRSHFGNVTRQSSVLFYSATAGEWSRDYEAYYTTYEGNTRVSFLQSHLIAYRRFHQFPGLSTATAEELCIDWLGKATLHSNDTWSQAQQQGKGEYVWVWSVRSGSWGSPVSWQTWSEPGPRPSSPEPIASIEDIPQWAGKHQIYRVNNTNALWVRYGEGLFRVGSNDDYSNVVISEKMKHIPQSDLALPFWANGYDIFSGQKNGFSPGLLQSVGAAADPERTYSREHFHNIQLSMRFVISKSEEQTLASGGSVTVRSETQVLSGYAKGGGFYATNKADPEGRNRYEWTLSAS